MTNTPAETVERQAIADELSKALVERNVSRYEAIAFVRRHEIIAALTAPAPSASVAGEAMLRQALEDIINPLGYLRREAEAQGNQLGGMAYQIASDPSMSRTIAKRALADYAALPSKPDAVTVAEEWDDDREYQRGKDDGATFVLEALADMIGAKDWHIADGSEEWEGDVRGTAYNILVAGGVVDDENGAVARHLRPGYARCPTCNGDFGQAEWDADNRCPECETPKPDAPDRVTEGERERLIEELRRQAINASDVQRLIAKEKSLRQSDNPEGRADLYSWMAPDQTIEGRAAVMLARLLEENEALRAAARAAHDTLIELNPNNYNHDDVEAANNAAIEAILLLADVLGETHGKTPEWWADRRAALGGETRP